MEHCYWRLVYADSVMDEPDQGGTILDSRPGALVLLLCAYRWQETQDSRLTTVAAPLRVPFCKVELFEQGDKQPFSPLFYRKRSMAIDGTDQRLDLTVFGRGRARAIVIRTADGARGEVGFDGQLWAYNGDMVTDCPQWAIDQAAIEHLLQAAVR